MAKRKSHQKSKIYSPFLLLIFFLGISLMSFAFAVKINAKKDLSFKKDIPKAVTEIKKEQPAWIDIPSLNINLPVGQTEINNGSWGFYEKGASHLKASANPGENGNIIIYAHNTSDRFGNILSIKPGEIIELSTASKTYDYKVISIKVVNPDQIELLLPTQHEVLTIYTCTGFADSKRFVIQATPIFK
jgi:sortase A